jgi:hypothetical protein
LVVAGVWLASLLKVTNGSPSVVYETLGRVNGVNG